MSQWAWVALLFGIVIALFGLLALGSGGDTADSDAEDSPEGDSDAHHGGAHH